MFVKRGVSLSNYGSYHIGGLPGSLGGAIHGNAGAFGGEIKNNLVKVKSFNPFSSKFMDRSLTDCQFDYRSSIFKKYHFPLPKSLLLLI